MWETKEKESKRKKRLSTNNFNLPVVALEANCRKRRRQNNEIIEEDVIEISEQLLPTSPKRRRRTTKNKGFIIASKSPECLIKNKVKPKRTQLNLESNNYVDLKHHLESNRRHSVDFYKQNYNIDKRPLSNVEEKLNISQYTTNCPPNKESRLFSPLPSTSKDNKVIFNNEKRFKESLVCNNTFVRTKKNNGISSTKHIQPSTPTYIKKQQRSGKNDKQHNMDIKKPLNIIESIDLTKNMDTFEVPLTINKYSNSQQDYGNNEITMIVDDFSTKYSHNNSKANDQSVNYNLDGTALKDNFQSLSQYTHFRKKSCPHDKSRKSQSNLNIPGTSPLAKTNGNSDNKTSNTKNNVLQEKMSSGIGDCPICYEKLSTKLVASTVCGHVFCMNCIKTATRKQKKCPSCRKNLKGIGYHPLFL